MISEKMKPFMANNSAIRAMYMYGCVIKIGVAAFFISKIPLRYVTS